MTMPPSRRRPQPLFWLLLGLVVAVAAVLVAQYDQPRILGMPRDEFGQLAYFVVILAFIGSAFLGRGLGVGDIVRGVAGWLAIFLVLIGAYAYRNELGMFGGRVLAVLAPGVPISGRIAGDTNPDTVVIVRGVDGHFGVRAEAEDVALDMMVDTGASFVTLTPADASRIGIDVGRLRYSVPIRTANGTIQAAPTEIGRLAVGSIERNGVPALVAPPDTLDQSLLGMSFLNTLGGYAIAGDRLILTP